MTTLTRTTPADARRAAPAGVVLRGVLHGRRRTVVLWSVATAGVAAMYTAFYPGIGGAKMAVMMEAMPPEMIEALGMEDLASAAGYVSSTVFALLGAILVLVCAIGLGARLVAGEEEEGTLELELTAPVPRGTAFAERLAALWLVVLAVVAAVVAVLLLLSLALDLDLSTVNLLAAGLHLWVFGGTLGTVALAVGAVTGRRAVALGVAAGIAVLSYVVAYLAPLVEGASALEQLSPYHWYIGGEPLQQGVDAAGLGMLLALAGVAALAGWAAFRRRDLMV